MLAWHLGWRPSAANQPRSAVPSGAGHCSGTAQESDTPTRPAHGGESYSQGREEARAAVRSERVAHAAGVGGAVEEAEGPWLGGRGSDARPGARGSGAEAAERESLRGAGAAGRGLGLPVPLRRGRWCVRMTRGEGPGCALPAPLLSPLEAVLRQRDRGAAKRRAAEATACAAAPPGLGARPPTRCASPAQPTL